MRAGTLLFFGALICIALVGQMNWLAFTVALLFVYSLFVGREEGVRMVRGAGNIPSPKSILITRPGLKYPLGVKIAINPKRRYEGGIIDDVFSLYLTLLDAVYLLRGGKLPVTVLPSAGLDKELEDMVKGL